MNHIGKKGQGPNEHLYLLNFFLNTDRPVIYIEDLKKILEYDLDSIKPYVLCGGTALAIQLGHRKSEDLDSYSPILEPVPFIGNIHLADVLSILAMKVEVMLRRMKIRDYYDIYSILKDGYNISKGIEGALKYSRHKLSTKNIVTMLLSERFLADEKMGHLEPKYQVSKAEMREYIASKLKDTNLI